MSSDSSADKPVLPPQTVRFLHDLRNGLASVRAGASMLQRSGHKPAVVEQVADGLLDQVRQMLTLIDGFVGKNAEPPHAAVAVASASASAPASSLKVLVADDNADAANALAMFLRLEGHRTVVAFDGDQALALATTDPPHVMLLDLTMPMKSGFDLAREIRSQPWGAEIRLIAVSGWFSPEDCARASAVGFDAQLCKPIDMDKLQELLCSSDTDAGNSPEI
jgi:CheY-like chemotaxis protein